ncbi:MAG: zinc ribbon domain-containing protein, partial [Azovibrio sp.]|nr:zinc ribbon domain-containing protein [Azovibrio sp.]
AVPEVVPEVVPEATVPGVADAALPSALLVDVVAASAPLLCSRCQAPVAQDDRYCGECGHKLGED